MPRAVHFGGAAFLGGTGPNITAGSGIVSYWYRAQSADQQTATIFSLAPTTLPLTVDFAGLIVWHEHVTGGINPGMYVHLGVQSRMIGNYMRLKSVNPIPYDSKYHNVWMAWDVVNNYGGQFDVAKLQLDRAAVNWAPPGFEVSNTSFTVDYSNDIATVGARTGTLLNPGLDFFIGDLAELYVDLDSGNGDYMIFNQNPAVFPQGWVVKVTVGGMDYIVPARLGDSGEAPLDLVPAFYLHGDRTSFIAGVGGPFTVNGSGFVSATSDPFQQ